MKFGGEKFGGEKIWWWKNLVVKKVRWWKFSVVKYTVVKMSGSEKFGSEIHHTLTFFFLLKCIFPEDLVVIMTKITLVYLILDLAYSHKSNSLTYSHLEIVKLTMNWLIYYHFQLNWIDIVEFDWHSVTLHWLAKWTR